MAYTKPLGLLAIVLMLSSCGSLTGFSSALPLTHNGNLAYTPLADQSLFPFPTPTPTPSPTPEPTATPIPTPRLEPTAKPTITIDCKTTAAASNLKLEVTGTLTYNKTAIPSASIYIGYSADCGNKWENFSLVQTHADGGFETVWIPNATGNYLISARWEGNTTLHWMNATVNLATTPDSAGNEFSVMSNSTVSNFTYNSTTQELSFNTNGTSSTTGYAHVCIPKTLVSDIQTVEVNVDGKTVTFTSESQDDVWVISCVYTQSQHAFTVKIPFMQTISPATTPWITIVVVIVVLIALVAGAVVIRRRRRTAATVASILKQNRPIN
jgi:hypothetical protein